LTHIGVKVTKITCKYSRLTYLFSWQLLTYLK